MQAQKRRRLHPGRQALSPRSQRSTAVALERQNGAGGKPRGIRFVGESTKARLCFLAPLPARLWAARALSCSRCCCEAHSRFCSSWNLFLSWKFKSSPMNLCIPDTVFRISLSDCLAGRSFLRARGSDRSNSRRVSGFWKVCWKSLMALQRLFLSLLSRPSNMHMILSFCLISAARGDTAYP